MKLLGLMPVRNEAWVLGLSGAHYLGDVLAGVALGVAAGVWG